MLHVFVVARALNRLVCARVCVCVCVCVQATVEQGKAPWVAVLVWPLADVPVLPDLDGNPSKGKAPKARKRRPVWTPVGEHYAVVVSRGRTHVIEPGASLRVV